MVNTDYKVSISYEVLTYFVSEGSFDIVGMIVGESLTDALADRVAEGELEGVMVVNEVDAELETDIVGVSDVEALIVEEDEGLEVAVAEVEGVKQVEGIE